MTFSSKVKNELVKIEYETNCCKKSMLYGMSLFAKSFSYREIVFQTENENIIMLYIKLLKELCNIDSKIVVSPSGKSYTASIKNKSVIAKLMNYFGHNSSETTLKINVSNFTCQKCTNAFLAGAFLSCGTISTPQKGYHFEFIIPYLNLTKSFITLLQELEFLPKFTNRKGYNIVYFKESETIEDFLYIMGAPKAMYDMMNIKIIKEIRNSANRKANCETANIEKMVKAASPQIAAIMKIQDKKGLDFLSEPLKEMAEIRLENPDLSLSELANLFEPPLSRSGVNHRLKRIVEIAKEL